MSGADGEGAVFDVVWTGAIGNRGVFVFARPLSSIDFEVTQGATLGGCPVQRCPQVPRRIGPDGRLLPDVFAFRLVREEDAGRLREGQRVELRPGEAESC